MFILTITHTKKKPATIQHMKNATTKKTSTTSALAKIGTKKMKPKSPVTPKIGTTTKKMKPKSPVTSTVGATKRGNPNRGTSEKKTTSTADQTPKKAGKHGKGSGKRIIKNKAAKTTSDRSSPQTPDRKVRPQSAHSTPSTLASNLTSSSKRAVSMMNSLELNSPTKKTKNTPDKQSTVDFDDASAFDWLNMNQLDDALLYHGEDSLELNDFDYHDKIVLLCVHFKPNDIRPVFQGVYQDAGMNWRDLRLAKHKSMKTLSAEFAKACANIYNARIDLTVPGKITIKQENLDQGSKM